MHRLFVDPARLADEIVVVSGEDHRYLTRVLRLAAGDAVTFFDGVAVEADARIIRVGPRALEARIEERRAVAADERPHVTLIQALTKGDKLDLVVQKATELGVERIIPVTSARSVPRLEAMRAAGRRSRWQKIARDAARQSGRADVPEVEPVTPIATAVGAAPKDAFKLMLWEGARQHPLRRALPGDASSGDRPRQIVIAIGPEGGFSAEEVELARAAGFAAVGLGPRILRTETAALVALSILGFALGDLG
jgi:16S rRNA (uracil1498-N3)-methyltransferase